MSIRLRVMSEGKIVEYRFDRAKITVGRGPSNDLVIASGGVGIAQGVFRLAAQRLSFTPKPDSPTTLQVRDGEVIAESEGVEEGGMDLESGDFLVFGAGNTSAQIEVLALSQSAPASVSFTTHAIEASQGTRPSASFAEHYLMASEELAAYPGEMEVLLGTLARVASEGLGREVRRLMLSIFTSQDEFLDEVWSVEGGGRAQRVAREPLDARLGERAPSAREALESGRVYLIASGSGAGSLFLPIRAGERSLGVVIVECEGELVASDAATGVARALGALAAPSVSAHQAEKRLRGIDEENRYFRERERRHYLFKELICESNAMRQVYRRLHELVQGAEPVLIRGEAGSGKELLGRALHHLGSRGEGMFISIHCGHLSDEVLGVELFGCVASELAGAVAARKGVFELAHDGTVYIEEVERLSLPLQGKLVRMLKEGEVRRVGDSVGRPVSARLVASATHVIGELVREGKFRHDLYLALKEGSLSVPPLRERRADLMPLARNFLKVLAKRHDRAATSFAPEVVERMMAYEWPGNVRELQTVVEAAVLKCPPQAAQITAQMVSV